MAKPVVKPLAPGGSGMLWRLRLCYGCKEGNRGGVGSMYWGEQDWRQRRGGGGGATREASTDQRRTFFLVHN